ncbi:MAG: threonine synthase [Deltaproteobacteria bacterium]
MTLRSVLRCGEGCPGDRSPFEAIFACPRCGGLLEVVHDVEALRQRGADDWRRRFAERAAGAPWPLSSGVWGKREWVLPELSDEDVISLGEGHGPLLPAPRAGRALGHERLWLKQCGSSHSGSFKDLGMTVLVSAVARMRREGRGPRAIACASTGDTSAALAAYAAAAGIPCAVLLPRGKITLAQLVQPLANGARVLALDTDFDGCMRLVEALAAEGSVYLANSKNPLRLEGQKTVAFEIAEQLGWSVPDWVFLPGGNLGNTAALASGFELLRELGLTDRLPRLGVVQAEAASPLYESFRVGFERFEPTVAGPTAASAIRIGVPVSVRRAIRALRRSGGIVERASEREMAQAAVAADRAGLFVCPQTAVALAGLRKAAAQGIVRAGERVVVVSTAHGLKFTEFQRAVEDGRLPGAEGDPQSQPVELDATIDAVRAALA